MSISSGASRQSSAASSPSPAGLGARLRAIAELPFLAAAREALPYSFAALLVAFVALLAIVHAPGPFFGSSLALRVSGALLPAFGFMGAALAVALPWRYAVRACLPRFAGVAACLVAYLLALPPLTLPFLAYLRLVGPSGLFVALGVGGAFALASRIARSVWVGALVVVALAAVLRIEHVSVAALVQEMLAPMGRLGDTYFALIAIVLVEMLLWTVGLHGPALLAAIVTPVYLTLQFDNTTAFQAHQPLPHIVVVSLFLFVFPGGSGATLPLAIAFAASRVRRLRALGRMSLLPALFNVNEPLLFGAPVVLNPYLIPPFLTAPLVLATITYVAVARGLVARPAFYVPSSVPTLVSTFLATVDPRAVVLALVNVVVATIIYLPFVRAYERHLEAQ